MPIVIGPAWRAAARFGLCPAVLLFLMASLLLHLECVPRELKASRWGPALSFRGKVLQTPARFRAARGSKRLLVFSRSLLAQKGRRIDWADIALSCGYFDQPHFIHDFRSFSGMNPTAYLAHCGEYANHVPILD